MNLFSKNNNLILNKKKSIKTFVEFILGSFLIAIAYNIFVSPNNLVPGGVGGIAVIINNLFGFDNATVIMIMNLVLLVFSFLFLGKEKTASTTAGTILVPILIYYTRHANVWIHMDTSKVLLSAIMGGIIYGVGLGLIFRGGFTTGGTDIINQIISKFFKVGIGKSMIFSDGLIVVLSGIFFGLYSMLYSILMLYIISIISDRIVLGVSTNKMFYIISEKDEDIRSYILNDLKHGATIFKAKGGVNTKKKNITMTVLPTKDFYRLKTNILKIDKEAFFIITDSYEVFGGE